MPEYIDNIKQIKELFSKRDILNEEFDRQKIQKALDRAYDMMKFEMELYWKRATYFWGFLAVSFTAYFILADAKYAKRYDLIMIVNSLGLIFSFGWYLVNRGSKYWQNNWFFVISSLEEMLNTPIHGLKRKHKHRSWHWIGAYPFSVTKIHQIISFFITLVWLTLFTSFVAGHWDKSNLKNENLEAIVLGIITILILLALTFGSLSNQKRPDISFNVRTVLNLIVEKEKSPKAKGEVSENQ